MSVLWRRKVVNERSQDRRKRIRLEERMVSASPALILGEGDAKLSKATGGKRNLQQDACNVAW